MSEPPADPQPSWRKPTGILLILALIGWPVLVQAIFYLVAGIAWVWVLPLRPLLCWMETGRWRAPQ